MPQDPRYIGRLGEDTLAEAKPARSILSRALELLGAYDPNSVMLPPSVMNIPASVGARSLPAVQNTLEQVATQLRNKFLPPGPIPKGLLEAGVEVGKQKLPPIQVVKGTATLDEYKRFKNLLKQEDYLGFDTVGQAIDAVATHPDWAMRWDVSHNPELINLGNKIAMWPTQIK